MISEQNISTTVPPKVYAVMVKYSQGIKMKQACEEVGIDPRTVKKWETTPEVKKFYSSLIKDAFVEGKNNITFDAVLVEAVSSDVIGVVVYS